MINYDIKNNLFSPELIENLAEKQGQSQTDFGLPAHTRVSDEITHAFSMAKTHWQSFKRKRDGLSENQSGVTEVRNHWIRPLFTLLDYDLQLGGKVSLEEGISFIISHYDQNRDRFPVHIGGFRMGLDQNPNAARGNRQSPHVQMQEYLNHTEHLYGIVTNGYKIRLLRDHHRITGIQFMEWDIQTILEENDLASFATLYRMLHVSRLPKKMGDDCLLENYHQDSVEEGHRVRNKLQRAVKTCLEVLGNGFLQHPQNTLLREQLEEGKLSEEEYGYLLRKLVYRLLFLLVAEERKLIFQDDLSPELKDIYQEYYSLGRFRNMAESYYAVNERHSDIWAQLKTNFMLFEKEGAGNPLGIQALGGDLFEEDTLGVLVQSNLNNLVFLKAIDLLSRFKNKHHQLIRINYRRINVEEFGAVYESLLDLHPKVDLSNEEIPFTYPLGKSRKSTGAYYTHDDLVKQLLKTALQPVLKERLKEAEISQQTPQERKESKEKALLNLKVCDPACGSGHFLLGAARALATELTHIRIEDESQFDEHFRPALRDVIEHCIYGVDINPDTVELCRLIFWMESHVPGKPIIYLNHKIKCGNSLLGWKGNGVQLKISEDAFKPVIDDDKEVALSLKQRNKAECKEIEELDFEAFCYELKENDFIGKYGQIDQISGNSIEDIWAKKRAHQVWEESDEVRYYRRIYDVWTFAFFQSFAKEESLEITQSLLKKVILKEVNEFNPSVKIAQREAKRLGFFHWELEFPHLSEKSEFNRGFDVILCNPPWERIKLQQKEFFANRSVRISSAITASVRNELIREINCDSKLFKDYTQAKKSSQCLTKFIRSVNTYNLTAIGDINTYSVFSELSLKLIKPTGRLGLAVPTGIATDITNSKFFNYLIKTNRLLSLFDFENKKKLFSAVASKLKFSMLTIYGQERLYDEDTVYGFFFQDVSELIGKSRIYSLTREDLELINPNTETSPIFRSRQDADLTKKIYHEFPIFVSEKNKQNDWGIKLSSMFHMSNDSYLFETRSDFNEQDLVSKGNRLVESNSKERYSLYEAKMFWLYNHRLSSFTGDKIEYTKADNLHRPSFISQGKFWIKSEFVSKKLNSSKENQTSLIDEKNYDWVIGFRKITGTSNERTFVSCVLPISAYSDSCQYITSSSNSVKQVVLLGMISSLVFDFICRKKISGNNISHFVVKQLPIIPPEQFTPKDLHFIVPRVLELTYTAWDLKAFADDVWEEADKTLKELIQNRWENNKRAIYLEETEQPDWVENPLLSKLAGETKEERENFPGETFRVLKEKEIKKYGEYLTTIYVLEAWNEKPWENPTEIDRIEVSAPAPQPNYELAKRMPYVMAYIIEQHAKRPRYSRTLGRTKMEKLLHGIETVAAIDLGRVPIMNEYGPADVDLIKQVERNAEEQQFFISTKEAREEGEGHRIRYSKSENFEEAVQLFHTEFSAQIGEIQRIVDLFLDAGREETELRMTVFAAWNNLLLDGVTPDDKLIVSASRTGWHTAKEEYEEALFYKALEWLRNHQLVPKGTGKKVEKR